MFVGRKEGARGFIDAVAGRAWDRAYRQVCVKRGLGHFVNVMPESEVYRFWKRRPVDIHQTRDSSQISVFNSNVESPVFP